VKRRAPWAVAALVLVVLGAWALTRDAAAPSRSPGPPVARSPSPPPSPAAPLAPSRSSRDPFRFADEGSGERGGEAARGSSEARVAPSPSPTPDPGPRLVGVVRRGTRTVAALSDGGEVELAGPGETAAGVVVVSIGDDGVRIRRSDGTEAFLPLP